MTQHHRPYLHPRWEWAVDLTVTAACDAASPPPNGKSPPSSRRIFQLVERLIQIWLANEQDLDRLRRLRLSGRRVRAYADAPGSSRLLVQALQERIGAEIRNACTRLGANDREARKLLAELSLGGARGLWKAAASARQQPEPRRRRFG